MHLDFSELLRQGGGGVIAYFALHALVVIWRRLTKREDDQLAISVARCRELESALKDRDDHIRSLHYDHERKVEKLHRERVASERMVISAAIAQAAVTKVTRDALDAMSENHRELVGEMLGLREALRVAVSGTTVTTIEVQEVPARQSQYSAGHTRKPLSEELRAPSAPELQQTTTDEERRNS